MGFFKDFAVGATRAYGEGLKRKQEKQDRIDEMRAKRMNEISLQEHLHRLKAEQKMKDQLSAAAGLEKSDPRVAELVRSGLSPKDAFAAVAKEREADLRQQGQWGANTSINIGAGGTDLSGGATDPFSQLEQDINPDQGGSQVTPAEIFDPNGEYENLDETLALTPEGMEVEGLALYNQAQNWSQDSGEAVPVIMPSKPTINDYQKVHLYYENLYNDLNQISELANSGILGTPSMAREQVARLADAFGLPAETDLLSLRQELRTRSQLVLGPIAVIAAGGDKRINKTEMENAMKAFPKIKKAFEEEGLIESPTEIMAGIETMKEIALKRYIESGKILSQSNVAAGFSKVRDKAMNVDPQPTQSIADTNQRPAPQTEQYYQDDYAVQLKQQVLDKKITPEQAEALYEQYLQEQGTQ